MAQNQKDVPLHMAHNYTVFEVPEFSQYGKYQGDMFWAKDESDAVLYLKKIKERKNIN